MEATERERGRGGEREREGGREGERERGSGREGERERGTVGATQWESHACGNSLWGLRKTRTSRRDTLSCASAACESFHQPMRISSHRLVATNTHTHTHGWCKAASRAVRLQAAVARQPPQVKRFARSGVVYTDATALFTELQPRRLL